MGARGITVYLNQNPMGPNAIGGFFQIPVFTDFIPAANPSCPIQCRLIIEGFWYTIQPRDTLLGICKRYGVKMSTVVKRNKISNPDRIIAGESLFIPRSTGLDTPIRPRG